jgi:hypothetical protein
VKLRIKALVAGGVLALALVGAAMAGPLEDGLAAYGVVTTGRSLFGVPWPNKEPPSRSAT